MKTELDAAIVVLGGYSPEDANAAFIPFSLGAKTHAETMARVTRAIAIHAALEAQSRRAERSP